MYHYWRSHRRLHHSLYRQLPATHPHLRYLDGDLVSDAKRPTCALYMAAIEDGQKNVTCHVSVL